MKHIRFLFAVAAAVMMTFAVQAEKTAKVVLTDGDHTLKFVYDEMDYGAQNTHWFSVADAEKIDPFWSEVPWYDKRGAINKVVFDESFRAYRPTQCCSWFYGFSSLATIEGISNLDTSAATNFAKAYARIDGGESAPGYFTGGTSGPMSITTGAHVALDFIKVLGLEIPEDVDYAAGDKVAIKVEGLAKGFKVVTAPVYEDPNAKKKVVVDYTYTLEGVPTETVDHETQAMYARVTVTYKDKTKGDKGKAETLQPIPLSITAPDPFVLTAGLLNTVYGPVDIAALWPAVADAKENPKAWSLKGWPAGITYTNGEVSGKPTKAGQFTVTATAPVPGTKYKNTYTAVFIVWPDETAASLKDRFTHQAYAPFEPMSASDVKSISGLPTGLKFTAKALTDKTFGEIRAGTVYGMPTKAGVYLVTIKTFDGKSTSILWTITPPDAPAFTLNTGTAPIAETKAQIVQGANLGFAIAASAGAKVTVAGLPAGLKLVQDKATKAYSVQGVATKPGEYRVAFKTVLNGVTTTSVVAFTVAANPYSGTYQGWCVTSPATNTVARCGTVDFTVAAAGTVKLTYTEGKTKYTASVKNFTWNDATECATAYGFVLPASAADKKLGYGARQALVTFCRSANGIRYAAFRLYDAWGNRLSGNYDFYAYETEKETLPPLAPVQTYAFRQSVGGLNLPLATVSVAFDAKKATGAFSGKLFDGTAIKATVPLTRVDDPEGGSVYDCFAPFMVVAKDGSVYLFDDFLVGETGGYIDWLEDGNAEYALASGADYSFADAAFAALAPGDGTLDFTWEDGETESFAFALTLDARGKPKDVAIYDTDPQEGELSIATVAAKMGKTTGAVSFSFTSKKGDKAKYAVDLVWQGEGVFKGQVTRTWKGLDPETNKTVNKTAYGIATLK